LEAHFHSENSFATIQRIMRTIKMDIRQFAVPSPRVGSIETHSGYGAPPLSGQEIHTLVQRKYERDIPAFVSEKPFSLTIAMAPYTLIISGRADGYISGSPVEILEFKTAFDIEELYKKILFDQNHPYVWQLRTYGYIHYKNSGDVPVLTLKLISSRNLRKTLEIEIELHVDDYEKWLERRLEELQGEIKSKEKVFKRRVKNAESMEFPFATPRPGQRELVATVKKSFEDEIPLLIQAPTGLGKTAGILYPAMLESFSRGQKVVYVTPKNSQHEACEKAVDLMNDQGADVKRLTITSKSKMCMKEEPLCNPHYCEYAKDYYSKVAENDLIKKLNKQKKLSSKKFIKLGEEFQVCPFELSLEGIDHADVVIGDYNYVFSPRSLVGRLSEPLLDIEEMPNLVIDEAHNLPSRAQDYFSPELSSNTLKNFQADFHRLPNSYALKGFSLCEELLGLIWDFSDSPDEVSVAKKIEIDPEPFMEVDKRIRDFTMHYLESDVEVQIDDPILRFSNYVSDFVSALELTGEEFFQTYQKNGASEVLKITCSDASAQLAKAYKFFKNTAAFSATLKPFQYYLELLGFPIDQTRTIEFSSPFKTENRKIVMIPQISTKFKDRMMSAPRIAEVIEKVCNVKKGNYMALFPSFEFMMKVKSHLELSGYKILLQERKMKNSVTERFLDELKWPERPTLLMGVQGGIFSEGVDYPGDMLIGVFVVGPALPNFDFERELIREYYGKRYGEQNAFDYAYVFPAMAKAIQSAGRVIRTETDRGVIILIDPRFLEPSYAETMPNEWFKENPSELLSQKILADLSHFWDGGKLHEA
jgi:DNA excision repair protein ERCC-2